jgi:hypothetical protein
MQALCDFLSRSAATSRGNAASPVTNNFVPPSAAPGTSAPAASTFAITGFALSTT